MSPSISVVIPTYNRRHHLLLAVRSALEQTLAPLEVIVVDDGSVDGSQQALLEAWPQGGKVRLVQMASNGGACRARNAGVEESSGEWIAFLDSDDAWEPNKLASQALAIASCDGAVACFTGLLWKTPGREPWEMRPPEPFSLRSLFAENTLGSTSTALVSRRALAEVGGFDPAFPSCQDWDLWLRLVSHGPVAIVPDPLTFYNDGQHERISRASGKVLKGNQMIFDRVYAMISDPVLLAEVKAAHLIFKSDLHSGNGRLILAFIHALRAHHMAPDARTSSRMNALGYGLAVRFLPGPVRRMVRKHVLRAA